MRFLIQHVLDEFAERAPDSVVFRCHDRSLSYGDCVSRTNQLAHALTAQGVRRGDRVGIYLHKSLESAIAVFGILKAGAVYVPIDPRLPRAALEYVLDQCDIRVLVSEASKLDQLQKVADGTPLECVIGVDRADVERPFRTMSWADVRDLPTARPPVLPGLIESDLAYIMYTSGSTGRPKGIMHTHHSGLRFAEAAASIYGLTQEDVLSNHSHLHFDMSTFDLFSGPICGATTVIIPESFMIMPASLSQLVQDEQLTVWYSVSSALVDLLLRGDLANRDLASLRWVIFGGEPFPPRHLHELMKLLPSARFSNVYGPAEVNVCTSFDVPPLPNQYEKTPIPIGRAWAIAEPMVIADDGQPAEAGCKGELLIASSARMAGYWKDIERTESVFLRVQPHADTSYEKIFLRTGDQVSIDANGEFLFHGRMDRQVKVRGFRIELDGVEAVLAQHPSVGEVAVWVSDQEPRGLRAAVRLRQPASDPDPLGQLEDHARRLLPHYAVPASITVLDRFPRTGSGKIDRLAIEAMLQDGNVTPDEPHEATA